ncbi:DUF1127 domain-containing protein [Pseudomonas sp.]|uniref:DUF1127 domain-containing protein n=1 Tax=Pseudomonas sp. TaxID=306 RepID=UPI00262FB3F1|nr:DUF1127 domain-containing protein [Pseudomonas sp.]
MNDLSDVRLTLRTAQLQAGRETPRTANTPADFSRWALFWHRLHTRHMLSKLDADELRDVGLSRQQALQESGKPFWHP